MTHLSEKPKRDHKAKPLPQAEGHHPMRPLLLLFVLIGGSVFVTNANLFADAPPGVALLCVGLPLMVVFAVLAGIDET